jgi:hypothetical protein
MSFGVVAVCCFRGWGGEDAASWAGATGAVVSNSVDYSGAIIASGHVDHL